MNPALMISHGRHTSECRGLRPVGDELVLMSAAFIWCTLIIGLILLACYLYQKWDRS